MLWQNKDYQDIDLEVPPNLNKLVILQGGRVVLEEGFAVTTEGLGHCPGGREVEPAEGDFAFFLGAHCLDVVSAVLI